MTDETPVTRLFGGPGSGKTTALLDRVESIFEEDPSVEVNDILVVSYTRAAANEVRERLAERLDVSPRSLQGNVCTMHAKAYSLLNLSRDEVVSDNDKKEFCEEYGLEYEDEYEGSLRRTARSTTIGNKVISTSQWLQRTCRDVADWYDVPYHWNVEEVRLPPEIDPHSLEGNKYTPTWSSEDDRLDIPEAIRAWRAYKGENDLVGFADMLERVYQRSLVPRADYLFIDEFQDITLLQYRVYEEWKPHMTGVCIAGDDDQVVYAWQGADPHLLLNEVGEDVILENSYRLPSRILQTVQREIRHIENRQRKDLQPRKQGGVVETHQRPAMMTLNRDIKRTLREDEGASIMVLFRARYQMFEFIDGFIDEGIRFEAMTDQRMWTPRLLGFADAIEALEEGESISLWQGRRLAEMLADSSFGTNDRGDFYDRLDEIEEAAPDDADRSSIDVEPETIKDLAPFLPDTNSISEMIRRVNSFQKRSLKAYYSTDEFRDLPPDRVRVGTIHSAKGREADHVYLATDLTEKVVEQMAASIGDDAELPEEGFTKDSNPVPVLTDNERRVFYVGMSRARERLVLLENLISGAPTLPIDVILTNRRTEQSPEELLTETWSAVEAD